MIRCIAVAARPPYSTGQWTAAHRPVLSSRCQAARRWVDFSPVSEPSSVISSLARNGGRCSSSHARNSSRKASSSGARAKSTPRRLVRVPSTLSPTSGTAVRGCAVDFTFDEQQLALQDVARQAMGDVDGETLRTLAEDPDGFTPELWERLVALGWTGMLVPGEGAGLLEMCIVLEQMGRVPLPGPFFSSSVMATRAAAALGADDLVAGLASGAQRGTVALHEEGYGNPLTTVRTRARRRGAGWVLTGTKPIVVDGHTADWAIVVALTEEGVRSFLLEPPRAEVVPSLDPTRKLARLVLDEQPAEPIGPIGDQAGIWREVLDDIAVGLAAELIGVSDRALEEAVEYSKTRVVFDRPIASFQSVKH